MACPKYSSRSFVGVGSAPQARPYLRPGQRANIPAVTPPRARRRRDHLRRTTRPMSTFEQQRAAVEVRAPCLPTPRAPESPVSSIPVWFAPRTSPAHPLPLPPDISLPLARNASRPWFAAATPSPPRARRAQRGGARPRPRRNGRPRHAPELGRQDPPRARPVPRPASPRRRRRNRSRPLHDLVRVRVGPPRSPSAFGPRASRLRARRVRPGRGVHRPRAAPRGVHDRRRRGGVHVGGERARAAQRGRRVAPGPTGDAARV